ncbi:hypothetical protein Fmac_029920 [Flemingia macrophylla]|uniref:Uncharacterized protein n=1 Tax=Flemingia macrophylla TaxID=520843 RepID=A0ABD1LBP5_9FABA
MRDNNNMDRTRRSTMPANPLFPRRRHPTISLRSSSQEDAARLKAKRRRACSNSNNNNNSHSTEEESVGNEQDARMHSSNTASSAPDQVIGAAVPRRTRSGPIDILIIIIVIIQVFSSFSHTFFSLSASVKRPYHSLVEEQSGEAASPSSYNLSLSKKMKPIGSKTGLPSSSNQEDIEIEIAELLYGLRASQNHGSSSSQKVEASDSRPARITSPTDVEKKKVEDYSSSCTPNISASETVRNESAKMEKASSESPSVLSCHGIESPQGTKQDIEDYNLNSRADCGDTADGRSKSKLDVDKHNSTSSSG